MAFRSGFFNSLDSDIRTYFNEDFSRLISMIITDGVSQEYGNKFIAAPLDGMSIKIQSGRCWFNDRWAENDSDYVVAINTAPIVSGYSRKDVVAIKVDKTAQVRDVFIEYIPGTEGSSPVEPTLTDTEDVHYHKLCAITVNANVTEITASNITNYVGTTSTPFITSVLESIDVTELLSQWDAQWSEWETNKHNEFDTWFDHMKGQLTTDAAGNLQTEIDNKLTFNGHKANINMELDGNVLTITTSDYISGQTINV